MDKCTKCGVETEEEETSCSCNPGVCSKCCDCGGECGCECQKE